MVISDWLQDESLYLHLMACNYSEDEVVLGSLFHLFAMSPQSFKVLSVLSGGSGFAMFEACYGSVKCKESYWSISLVHKCLFNCCL